MSRPLTKPAQTRWGIVTTAKEVPDLLLAFVAHHAAMGASRIHLYLDDPDPDLAAQLEAIPGCDVTQCDEAYWNIYKGKRPSGQENRQVTNAMEAYERTDVDWLLHIDADEFLNPVGNIATELAFVPDEISFVGVDMRERVYTPDAPPQTIFSGMFRVPFDRRTRAARAVFGDMVPYTSRGLSGQSVGKSFVRVGLPQIIMGIHAPRVRRPGEDERLVALGLNSATLLHFDGLTPAHWSRKLARYGSIDSYVQNNSLGDARTRQIQFVRDHAGDPDAVRKMHDLLKTVDAQQAARLRALGYLEPAAVDPSLGLQVFGLSGSVDLSVEYFDNWMAGLLPEKLKEIA